MANALNKSLEKLDNTKRVFTWSPYFKEDFKENFKEEIDSTGLNLQIPLSKEDINDLIEDENYYIGSQGQIISECPLGAFTGSGMLFIQIEPEKSKKQFVLTCAHNFLINNKEKTEFYKSQCSTFYFRKSRDNKTGTPLYDDKSELVFYVHEKYEKNPLKPDFFKDFAIGICKDDLSKWIKQKNIYIMDLEEVNAKQDDEICIAGYPYDENDKNFQEALYFTGGTIKEIQYNPDDKDEAIIIYDLLDTLGGQSGSPVYLKYNDTWVVIGVHIGCNEDRTYNRAVGITSAKKSWISKIVDGAELPF